MIKQKSPARQESGAATLVIVMALFILIGLLAAYGNRNLVFEQRMAGSTLRAAVAGQTAESAIDWTLAMLNSDFTDTACVSTNAATTFSARYIAIDKSSRTVTLDPTPPPPSPDTSLGMGAADCVKVAGGGWDCRCLNKNATSRRAALGNASEPQPSFVVSFAESRRPGTVLLNVTACTSSVVQDCASKENTLLAREAAAEGSAVIGFVPAMRTPPSAAITVKGRIESTDGNLGIKNDDPRSNGLLAVTGDSSAPTGLSDSKLESLPGTLPRGAIVSGDSSLASGDVFKMFFGMPLARFKYHPGVRKIDCNPDCTTSLTAAAQKGASIVLVDGDLDVSTSTVVGSTAHPVLIVVTGSINIAADFQMFGMIFSGGAVTWNSGSGYLVGAVISASDFVSTGSIDVSYSSEISDLLRNRVGSFVRVSGGWYDKKL